MERIKANEILRLLKTYYPARYPEDMSDEKAGYIIQDLMESFEIYHSVDVIRAYKDWNLHFSQPPAVSDIKNLLSYSAVKEDPKPARWTDYFEDHEGYGYARNSKTKEFHCIWKPHWIREREFAIPYEVTARDQDGYENTFRKGDIVKMQALSKAEVLKRYGIGV